MASTDPVKVLPVGVIEHLLTYADIDDLARLTTISRTWKRAANQSLVWNRAIAKYLPALPRAGEPVQSFGRRMFIKARNEQRFAELQKQTARRKVFVANSLAVTSVLWLIGCIFALPVVWKEHPHLCKIMFGIITGYFIASENLLERIWRSRIGKYVLIVSGVMLLAMVSVEVQWVRDTRQSTEVQREALVLLYLIHCYRYIGLIFIVSALCLALVLSGEQIFQALRNRTFLYAICLGPGFIVISEVVLRVNYTAVLDHEPFFWEIGRAVASSACFLTGLSMVKLQSGHHWILKHIRTFLFSASCSVLCKSALRYLGMPSPAWMWVKSFIFLIRGVLPHSLPAIGLAGLISQARDAPDYPESLKKLTHSLYLTNAIVLEAVLIIFGRYVEDYRNLQLFVVQTMQNPGWLRSLIRSSCIFMYILQNQTQEYALSSKHVLTFWFFSESLLTTNLQALVSCVHESFIIGLLCWMVLGLSFKVAKMMNNRPTSNSRLVMISVAIIGLYILIFWKFTFLGRSRAVVRRMLASASEFLQSNYDLGYLVLPMVNVLVISYRVIISWVHIPGRLSTSSWKFCVLCGICSVTCVAFPLFDSILGEVLLKNTATAAPDICPATELIDPVKYFSNRCIWVQ